jgi:hypothetical protein
MKAQARGLTRFAVIEAMLGVPAWRMSLGRTVAPITCCGEMFLL